MKLGAITKDIMKQASLQSYSMRAGRLVAFGGMFLLMLSLVSGCGFRENKSGLHWFLDMHDSHAIEAQEEDFTTLGNLRAGVWKRGADARDSFGGPGSSVRVPPAGTVPQGYEPYLYTNIETAGRELKNPLPTSRSVLERGQKQYNIYCAVCHGVTGKSDGPVVPRFPKEVSRLADGASVQWADGKLFHMITMGRGAMGSYAAQVNTKDRWAIIHYIRLLQKNAK